MVVNIVDAVGSTIVMSLIWTPNEAADIDTMRLSGGSRLELHPV